MQYTIIQETYIQINLDVELYFVININNHILSTTLGNYFLILAKDVNTQTCLIK